MKKHRSEVILVFIIMTFCVLLFAGCRSVGAYELIFPYIEKDPKAYFMPEKYRKAFETLLEFTELRAESVRRQLNGQLASKSDLQTDEDKVDASRISRHDQGSAF